MRVQFSLRTLLLSALGLGALSTALVLIYRTPPMPEEFHRVKIGMTFYEAKAVLPELRDLREMKGFAVASKECDLPFRRCYWQIFLFFNKAEKVHEVNASFTDRDCGLFN